MKVSKKNILKWTAALRSGEYKQSTGVLQGYGGFCCLGVACAEFIPEGKVERSQVLHEPDGTRRMLGVMPEQQPAAPRWLQQVSDDFRSKTGIGLASLNDASPSAFQDFLNIGMDCAQPFTFDEIADLLEAVYVHKVLDEPVVASA